jgi:8-oxo-dGTP pyrophosphatase MutT (NUDIX family)
MSRLDIVDVAAIDCDFAPQPWPFEQTQAAKIDAHWGRLRAEKPSLFNGRVLLQYDGAVVRRADGPSVFRGAYLEADFKAFIAWRDFGFPAIGVRNGFGMAALSTADGAFVLGEMASHTANAGKIYFASGTPDPSDIREGKVDIESSVRRELTEETGISADEVTFDDGFTVMMDQVRVAFLKRVRTPLTADALVARIHAFLARDPQPELARMHIVRKVEDMPPATLGFVQDYLRNKLAGI